MTNIDDIDEILDETLEDVEPEAPTRRKSISGTVIGLVIASFCVGVVLAVLGINPIDFWTGIYEGVVELGTSIFGLGWSAIYNIGLYLAYGAAIVIPVWGIVTLLNMRK